MYSLYNTNFKLLSISCISYTKVLIDKFHIVNLVKRAFNQTRISIMNSIKKKYEAIIPIAGYTDDVAGMIFAIRKCMDYVDDEIKQNVSSKLVAWFDVEKDYVDDLLKDI